MDESNVKLMALVPMNMTHNLQQTQAADGLHSIPALHTNPELMRLKTLEEELLTVLNERILDPEIKIGKYIELLNKHYNILKTVNKPLRIGIQGTINKVQDENHAGAVAAGIEQREGVQEVQNPDLQTLMEKLSTRNRHKAKSFLSQLEKSPFVTWDQNNDVSIRGTRIKNSNIWKIFSDFFSNRKKTSPGFNSVAYELMDAKVPKNLFINRAAFDPLQKSRNKARFRKRIMHQDGISKSKSKKHSAEDDYEENIGNDLAYAQYSESNWP